jgi:TonB family protein
MVILAAGTALAQQQREPQPVRPTPVIVQPLVVRQVEPEYTAAALKARVAGDVHVVAVVRPDGTVAAAEVIKSLDPQLGLDERALDAVRQWTFEPGTVDGKPVPFAVSLVLEFRIRERNAVFPEGTTNVHLVGVTPRQRESSLTVAAGVAPEGPARIYRSEPGITLPVPERQVPPQYPTDAMREGVSGTVVVDAAVQPDGKVSETRVVKSLGYHLDRAASEAVEQWLFKPGRLHDKPVPAWVSVAMEFVLDDSPAGRIPSIALPSGPASPAERPRTTREEFGRGAYSDRTLGLVKPKLLTSRPAQYTFAAMRARLQGVVEVDVVVQPDGTVGRARVARGLNPSLGLDDQALVAVRDWRFSPGEIDGKPVAVVTTVLVEFRLQ